MPIPASIIETAIQPTAAQPKLFGSPLLADAPAIFMPGIGVGIPAGAPPIPGIGIPPGVPAIPGIGACIAGIGMVAGAVGATVFVMACAVAVNSSG